MRARTSSTRAPFRARCPPAGSGRSSTPIWIGARRPAESPAAVGGLRAMAAGRTIRETMARGRRYGRLVGSRRLAHEWVGATPDKRRRPADRLLSARGRAFRRTGPAVSPRRCDRPADDAGGPLASRGRADLLRRRHAGGRAHRQGGRHPTRSPPQGKHAGGDCHREDRELSPGGPSQPFATARVSVLV